MQKKTFTKEQLADTLGIQPYMVAAWQKQFDIEPSIDGGYELFSQKDLDAFKTVKELMYERGMTLDAAKKYLKEGSTKNSTLRAASPLLFSDKSQPSSAQVFFSSGKSAEPQMGQSVRRSLLEVRQQLKNIRDQLD